MSTSLNGQSGRCQRAGGCRSLPPLLFNSVTVRFLRAETPQPAYVLVEEDVAFCLPNQISDFRDKKGINPVSEIS